jgi:hypothetical protein
MTDKDRAYDYVHGGLSPDERTCVAHERLYNKKLDDALTALERAQATVEANVVETAAAPDIWSKLHGALRQENDALSGTSILEFVEGEWIPDGTGVEFKQLWNDNTILLRCEPGAFQDSHEQPSDQEEHIVVMAGNLLIGGRELRTGDSLVIAAGSLHPRMSTQGGCILFQQYV